MSTLRQGGQRHPLSLLLIEGDTELYFYDRLKTECFCGVRLQIKNLKGLFNINEKVINAANTIYREHCGELARLYCCVDRESRYGQVPGLDLTRIKEELIARDYRNILSVDSVIATQQIECWFMYDIVGIYKFLKTPRSQRNPKAFDPPPRHIYKDLERLFKRAGKDYRKGNAAQNFINSLDIQKIIQSCKELRDGIEKIRRQANSISSQLFP